MLGTVLEGATLRSSTTGVRSVTSSKCDTPCTAEKKDSFSVDIELSVKSLLFWEEDSEKTKQNKTKQTIQTDCAKPPIVRRSKMVLVLSGMTFLSSDIRHHF